MTDNGASFNRPYKPFGMNIKVPERTIQQISDTLTNIAKAPSDPLFKFLEENEQVFNGDLVYEINKITAESFTIGSAMRLQDQKTNGNPPNFDMHF